MYRWSMGLLVTAMAFSAHALEIKLPSDLTVGEKSTLQNVTQEVLAKLPPVMQNQLAQTQVSLSLDSKKSLRVGEFLRGNIVLSKQLVDEVASAAQPEQIAVNVVFAQHHANIKELLQATLIHEIAHLYDSTAKISKNPHFMDVAGFPLVGMVSDHKRRRINFLEDRAVDPYQWTNPQEAFAVNLEYFLLDPEFQCREPSMNQVLSDSLQGYEPFSANSCQGTQAVMVSGSAMMDSSGRFQKLDPSRVYQVQYFFAGKGDQTMSRFGHAMLRFVVCSPQRAEVGPDCLKDLSSHLIVSFRAAVADFKINSFDGMRGNYPSIPFILPLTNVVPEYTKMELREIHSVPLKFTRAEIVAIVKTAIEIHWTYEGKYKFLSNNCADETLRLLKLALPERKDLQALSVARPDALLEKLTALGLTDLSYQQDLKTALLQGYYFPSKRTLYEAAVQQLQKHQIISAHLTLDKYLETPPEQRAAFIALAEEVADADQQRIDLAALLNLEDLLLMRDKQQAYKEMIDTILKHEKQQDEALKNDLSVSKKILSMFSSPSHLLLKSGYGIPTDQEVLDIQKNQKAVELIAQAQNIKNDLDAEMKNWVKPATLEKLAQTQANMKELSYKFASKKN